MLCVCICYSGDQKDLSSSLRTYYKKARVWNWMTEDNRETRGVMVSTSDFLDCHQC